MRSLLFSILALCLATQLAAQAPPRMSYQCVVRDDADQLVTNSTVALRLSVLQGSDTGTPVFVETHLPATNANGLASVAIGAGSTVSGSVEAIDWSTGPYFLKTEMDPDGGSNFSISGTSELLSVPYALHAANSAPGPPGPTGMPGADGCEPTSTDSLIVLYTQANAYAYYQEPTGVGNWIIQQIGNTNHSGIANKKAVVLYNQSNAYAFYLDNDGIGQWSVQALGNTNHIAAASDRSIVLYNNSNAYAFHVDGGGAGTWTTQPLGNTNHSNKAHGNKIVVYNNSTAFAFAIDAGGNGLWSTQALGNTTHNVITTR